MATYVPQDLAFADTAPVRIDGAAVVDGTPSEVWAVLCDHANWPRWFGSGVTTCEPTSDPPSGVGSTRVVGLGVGGKLRIHERFIAWDEATLWAFTATEGPGAFRSLVERCTIEDLGAGRCRVAYRMAIDPAPLLKPFVSLLKRRVSRALGQGMYGLAAEVKARR